MGALLATAFLTAFYMGRVLVLTFLGKPSPAAAHAHESPPAMTIPLVALGIPTVVGGLLGPWLARGLGGEMHLTSGSPRCWRASPGWAAWGCRSSPTCAAERRRWRGPRRAGPGIGRGPRLGVRLPERPPAAGGGLRWVDRYLVDGLMNGVGWGTLEAGQAMRPVQTGRTRDYALAVVVGALLLLVLGAWR